MVFTKYVEVGRIVFVPSKKTIFTVVDVIDKNHVIIDSPTKDSRQKINMNNIQLTKFKLDFLFGAKTSTVKKACDRSKKCNQKIIFKIVLFECFFWPFLYGKLLTWAPNGPKPPGPRKSSRNPSEPTLVISTDLRSWNWSNNDDTLFRTPKPKYDLNNKVRFRKKI